MKFTFSGATTSGWVELPSDLKLVGLHIPSGFVGTTIDFHTKVTPDGSALAIRDVGGANVYQVTAGASRFIPLDPRVFAGLTHLRLTSSNSETLDITGCVRSID